MLTDLMVMNLPEDLQEEVLTITEWLPPLMPVSYPKAKTLIYAWRQLSEEALAWSGAKLVTRIDGAAYRKNPDQYQSPEEKSVDYTADLWQPFAHPWRMFDQSVDLAEIVGYLKLHVGTWGKTQVARRRHHSRDRLDSLALGIQIRPINSTAALYLLGERSLVEIIRNDLKDQR
ncbi:hypothetical protein [Candidatus Igneacidithiobacillus taiwanensis]|uniref:hypothetical protein n=1 Tax=Candidatus Igneacidithiobacillus taiwanensis TaxID=1945924 RepID=UPI0028963F78|nr:hypothetical protein [Candidatus Igneacidithiobacillus taiwanensis]